MIDCLCRYFHPYGSLTYFDVSATYIAPFAGDALVDTVIHLCRDLDADLLHDLYDYHEH